MSSLGGLCPACKSPMAQHLPSARRARDAVPPGMVDVVNGRCRSGEAPAAQKCCWVQLSEPMTPADYRERFEAEAIRLEPCPCCGGRLAPWGSFPRLLADGEPAELAGLRLLRGLCGNPDCPVRTVTHYPCFVTPYHVVPMAARELAVRAHVEQRLSWSEVGRQAGWAVVSVRRWYREIATRAAEVVTGLLGVWQRLDHRAPAELRTGASRDALLRALFRVCDAVAGLLRRHEGWTAPLPALAVPRMFRPPAPTTLPVWT